jgi:hypothetical protein
MPAVSARMSAWLRLCPQLIHCCRGPLEDGHSLTFESRSHRRAGNCRSRRGRPGAAKHLPATNGSVHADQGDGAACLDLYGEVYVAVGAIVAASSRAEHRKVTNAEAEFRFLRRELLSHGVKSVRCDGVVPGIQNLAQNRLPGRDARGCLILRTWLLCVAPFPSRWWAPCWTERSCAFFGAAETNIGWCAKQGCGRMDAHVLVKSGHMGLGRRSRAREPAIDLPVTITCAHPSNASSIPGQTAFRGLRRYKNQGKLLKQTVGKSPGVWA